MYKQDRSKSKVQSDDQVELIVYLDEEDQIKEVFELNIGNNVIGSSSKDSTIVINKPEIEKKHVVIEVEYDSKMNTLICQIQSLKSDHGTQKKLKDGNLSSFLPGKWNPLGDLSKEPVFYIAKKYKCLVRKVAKNMKQSKSIDGSSNQNSNSIPISKINFLKSLDNLEADESNKENNQMETKSDIVVQSNQTANAQENSATKPKMFGKNFKPKNSSLDVNKNLHSKFKTPSVSNEKQSDVAQKMEEEKTDKKNQDKKNEKKSDLEPVITLKIPSSPQVTSSKTKDSEQNKSKLKELQKNNASETNQKEETQAKKTDEGKGKQKGKTKKNQNKKKGSEELDLSLDLSLEMSDEDKKQNNAKSKMIDEKEIVKIASTDDEDEEDRVLSKKLANKNQANKESESSTKNDAKIKQTNKKNQSKDNKQQQEDEKKEKGSLLNKKRKAEESKDSKLMDIEEEQEQKENKQEVVQKKGNAKPSVAQNTLGNKKRKTDQDETEKAKKANQESTSMKDETLKNKTNNLKKDKKQSETVMEDENKQIKKQEESKSVKNKQPSTSNKDDQKSKKETKKAENLKESKKEAPTKSAKSSLAAAKKADKKKLVQKNQEKRNSLVKQNLDNELEESEDELSYVINSDGEEEFVLKGNKSSMKSAVKQTSKKYNVIFSNCMLDETDVQNRLSKLGVRIMKSIQQPFNILIMDEFTRRAKTLVALNKGAKIISSQWVLDCICQEHLIEEIDKYEIKVDKAFCKKHKFDLKEVQQRYQNQNKPIFQDIKFILPDDENYSNIAKDDLEYIIMTAGGSIITEEECDEIEDKSNIKVIFDNEKNDESHTTPEKNQSKSKLSDSKKKNQDETRVKLQYSYKKNNFDCVLIESIFHSCLHQKVCNWNDFQV